MVECRAAVNLPRFPRGTTAHVDETDARIKKLIRAGYLVPLEDDPEAVPAPVKGKKP